MEKILIDTDVILDFFLDRKPFSEFATEVLNRCEANKIQGFITPVIICNVYYLLRKSSKHQKVIDGLKQLLTFVDILNIDREIVLESLNSEFKDFEDALQNFSALKHNGIGVVLTRNIKDFKKSELAVMTPETYIRAGN